MLKNLVKVIPVLIMCLVLLIGCADAGKEAKKTDKADKGKAHAEKSADDATRNSENPASVDSEKDREDKKDSRKESVDSKKDKKDKKDSRKESTAASSNASAASSGKGKKWVPAVYKTVTHPATTKPRKVVDYYTCQCGATFATDAAWQAHRPKPWNGQHTYAVPHTTITTVTVPGYTEQVLVSEGHWE